MTGWAVGLSLVFLATVIGDWRKGLFAVLLVGFLQDVFRKLTPGAPAYFIVWSLGIFAIVVFAAFAARKLPPVSMLYFGRAQTRMWLRAFIGIVLLQLLHSLLRYGNPAIGVLGALFYLGPFVAMLVGAGFADSERRLRQFMLVYLLIFVPTSLTIYLSLNYSDAFPVLRDIGTFTGEALKIYDVGTILQSNPGLLRTGEIAAWHAATCIVFLSIFSITSRSVLLRAMNVALSILLVGAIILTGRRKMLVAVSIFFAIQWGLLIMHRWGLSRLGAIMVTLAVGAAISFSVYEAVPETEGYLARSQTAYSSIDDRAQLTLDLARSAIVRSSGVGLGAGAASHGARYAGGGVSGAGGSAEAGLGKIIVELGIPGFLLMFALVISTGLAISRQLPSVQRLGTNLLIYDVSFVAFLISNLAAFAVASQLYADFFVLIIIGITAGFVARIHQVARAYPIAQRNKLLERGQRVPLRSEG